MIGMDKSMMMLQALQQMEEEKRREQEGFMPPMENLPLQRQRPEIPGGFDIDDTPSQDEIEVRRHFGEQLQDDPRMFVPRTIPTEPAELEQSPRDVRSQTQQELDEIFPAQPQVQRNPSVPGQRPGIGKTEAPSDYQPGSRDKWEQVDMLDRHVMQSNPFKGDIAQDRELFDQEMQKLREQEEAGEIPPEEFDMREFDLIEFFSTVHPDEKL